MEIDEIMKLGIVKNLGLTREGVYSLVLYVREETKRGNIPNSMDIAIEIFSGSDFDEWLVTDSEKEYYRSVKSFQDLRNKILDFVTQEGDTI